MSDARDRHIARLEGKAYIPSGSNNDSIHTSLNGAEIDTFHLESFDAWVSENKIDVTRLMGLLKTRSTTSTKTSTKPSALENTTSFK